MHFQNKAIENQAPGKLKFRLTFYHSLANSVNLVREFGRTDVYDDAVPRSRPFLPRVPPGNQSE